MRRLPPLASLRAFEAAARHSSFKKAAEELGVTPTAISHQVRLLEETLRLRLFERRTRRVALTVEGGRLFPVLRDGFDSFAHTLAELTARRERRILTLSATTAFTAKWLVPRVADFRRRHPTLDLRLHASDDVVDLRSGAADAAIRYGAGPFPDLAGEPMIRERFAPVCNPRLGVRTPEDLASATLLHSEWRHAVPGNPTWRLWRERAGLKALDVEGGITFTDDSHTIQAAVAGQGVALLGLTLIADELAAGLLVQPFGPILPGHHYHFVHLEPARHRPEVAALREWLLGAVGEG
ncbi:transcriptional regulator GcvA [Inquilinus sp. CAU 1745]|uniref:transcriptional regulator GcvA n=1 Tax=Inquilinus sp. CAU 1745 TaxID=3140369 RepID=UPI00325C2DFC